MIITTYTRNGTLRQIDYNHAARVRAEIRQARREQTEHQIVCGVLWGISLAGGAIAVALLAGWLRWPL